MQILSTHMTRLLTFLVVLLLDLRSCLSIIDHIAFHSPLLHPLFSLAISKITKDVRRVLLDNVDPSSIDANNLVGALPLNFQHKAAARHSLKTKSSQDVYTVEKSVLSTDQVQRLRTWAEEKINGGSLDSVDGCPEWQVPLDRTTMNTILGEKTTDRLFDLPSKYLTLSASIESYDYPNSEKSDVGCFIRKYDISGRPFIGFHVDDCDATVNISLSDPLEFDGGKLLLIGQEMVLSPIRTLGDALIHPWYTCHAVTAVTKGERWTLIMFFSNMYPPDHSGFYKRHAPPARKKRN